MKTPCRNAVVAAAAVAAFVGFVPPLVRPSAAAVVARPRPRARVTIVVGRPVAMARPVVIAGVPHGVIDFDVHPETTEVYVDGRLRGQADDFDGFPDKLYLRAGVHAIALRTPDGRRVSRKVRILAGHEINLKLDLDGAGGTERDGE